MGSGIQRHASRMVSLTLVSERLCEQLRRAMLELAAINKCGRVATAAAVTDTDLYRTEVFRIQRATTLPNRGTEQRANTRERDREKTEDAHMLGAEHGARSTESNRVDGGHSRIITELYYTGRHRSQRNARAL